MQDTGCRGQGKALCFRPPVPRILHPASFTRQMGNPTATLERENLSAMNAPAPELDDAERPRAATMKFTHPSGARPLDGYTIKRGVGRGGFGEVYFATSDAGKEVALKLIRRNLDVELRGVTQCLNLKHSNLIALYDIRTDSMGDQWVVMEYVSGESLEDVIERNPNGVPIDEALWWMRGICAGVSYLHDHGIVHRDLKPGNIFSDEGTVKIGDYGLAKFISCSRRSGQTESVGTVHYMAPEIANGRYGREIDTYALGIILFEMITGHVPFEGESIGEVLMKHLTAEPDLTVLAEPYRDIVQRALAKDPNLRLKNVGELVALLPGSDATPQPQPPRVESQPEFQPAAKAEWPVSRSPALKAADAAAMDGLKQVVHWNKSPGEKVEEPIWKAIRETFGGDNFQKISPLKKAFAIFALVIAVLMYGDKAISIGTSLLMCYVVYYIIWTSISKKHATVTTAADKSAAANARAAATANAEDHTAAWPVSDAPQTSAARGVTRSPIRPVRSTWRDRARQQLAAKTAREKISELLGSMILAAIVAGLAACAAPLLLSNQPGSEQMATYLWLAFVGTLGSWAVLVPSKYFEGRLEDHVPIRISLLLLGTLVGVSAWFLGDALMLKVPGWHEPVDVGRGIVTHNMLNWPTGVEGANPAIAVYVAYFAFLFLVPRWWRQTEYTRDVRMSLWCIITCGAWAWLLHIFWWFPQPLGVMAAVIIALATQLASPWMPPSQRRALAESPNTPVV
jgi:serine/threonine protein kinase